MHPIHNLPVPGNAEPAQTVIWDDFTESSFSETAGLGRWYWETNSTGSALSIALDQVGGALLINGATTAGDPTVVTGNGAPFVSDPDAPIYFEARLKVEDADVLDWLVGLMTAATTDPQGTAPTNGVYMGAVGDASIDYIVEPGATTTDSGKDVPGDLEWFRVAFQMTSKKAVFFIDLEDGTGPQKVGVVESGLPAAGTVLQPNFSCEGGDLDLFIDYVYITQPRVST